MNYIYGLDQSHKTICPNGLEISYKASDICSFLISQGKVAPMIHRGVIYYAAVCASPMDCAPFRSSPSTDKHTYTRLQGQAATRERERERERMNDQTHWQHSTIDHCIIQATHPHSSRPPRFFTDWQLSATQLPQPVHQSPAREVCVRVCVCVCVCSGPLRPIN
jgi:hypothetical protein